MFPAVAGEVSRLPDYVTERFGHPPASIPDGPLPSALIEAVEAVFVDSLARSDWGAEEKSALQVIRASDDPRLAWVIVDMMRFTWRPEFDDALAETGAALLTVSLQTLQRRNELTDYLIAWDIPAFPGYLDIKRAIYTRFVPGWDRIFVEGQLDWRLVSWGGVPIDDRPYNMTDALCPCIPAVDNPDVTPAKDAAWLDDDDIVFGLVINGEARAYPRRIMEVREMVNDTLGGRDLGIPYCTLCGAAQAFFTDNLPSGVKRPVLRTSGLLIRSNKVMYDLETYSVFDTFLGKAVTGPLAREGLVLKQATLITTDWGSWRQYYPETTVLMEKYALGRDYNLRENRDAKGPIFPIGDVDPRLAVKEDVLGVIASSGTPVAFPLSKVMSALQSGAEVRFENVHLRLDAGGIRAVDDTGTDLGSHQAFWFAWSQFHPDTALWGP